MSSENVRGNVVVDRIDSAPPSAASEGAGVVVTLGTAIGEEAAYRIQQGAGTLCDVVLASWVVGVDSVQAVVDYADIVLGTVIPNGNDSRCA
ncbi:hypothetical protein [Nocardia jiangsuensis]|uniref:Uncharacterized protein n=1 Tax=Nocardia jiangsuensis TaxID=1691563 RepID=A0ABV8DTU1_9NOCA